MRKVKLTECQLNELFGSGFTSYLDKSDNGNDISNDNSPKLNGETFTKDPDSDYQPTTDDISRKRVNTHPYLRRSAYYCTVNEMKNKINEDKLSKEVDRKYSLGTNLKDKFKKKSKELVNDKLVNNLSNEDGMTPNSMYVRLNRLKKMRTENPDRYRNIDGSKIETAIKNKLSIARNGHNTNFKK